MGIVTKNYLSLQTDNQNYLDVWLVKKERILF
jgi:hypothetical protein